MEKTIVQVNTNSRPSPTEPRQRQFLHVPRVLSCRVLWTQPPGSGLKDYTRTLTKLSSILMRASNSCSPSRLFCMGPKVLPAHCTEPTSCGRCFSCSRRMRFSVPPALDRADTCREIRALSQRCMESLKWLWWATEENSGSRKA